MADMKCSFCKKSRRDVRRLVTTSAHPVAICDECMTVAFAMMIDSPIRFAGRNDTLAEALADLEHDRWSRWQRHLHRLCLDSLGDGSLVIPAGLVERWERQMKTPYSELSEEEKDSDRAEANKTMHLLRSMGVDLGGDQL